MFPTIDAQTYDYAVSHRAWRLPIPDTDLQIVESSVDMLVAGWEHTKTAGRNLAKQVFFGATVRGQEPMHNAMRYIRVMMQPSSVVSVDPKEMQPACGARATILTQAEIEQFPDPLTPENFSGQISELNDQQRTLERWMRSRRHILDRRLRGGIVDARSKIQPVDGVDYIFNPDVQRENITSYYRDLTSQPTTGRSNLNANLLDPDQRPSTFPGVYAADFPEARQDPEVFPPHREVDGATAPGPGDPEGMPRPITGDPITAKLGMAQIAEWSGVEYIPPYGDCVIMVRPPVQIQEVTDPIQNNMAYVNVILQRYVSPLFDDLLPFIISAP